jgi:hypothetical protein
VRRDHLIPDTLIQVQRAISRGDLAKPLKVHFMGEEGVDEGGVQKEFFQLVIRQIFDPAFCMFSYDEDTRLFWFKVRAAILRFQGGASPLIGGPAFRPCLFSPEDDERPHASALQICARLIPSAPGRPRRWS